MNTLHIYNYKCLNSLEISGFNRVNLFTGKNNSGKSTILEALSLFASKGNIEVILRLLQDRGVINTYADVDSHANEEFNKQILSSFFSNRLISFAKEKKITIKGNDDSLEMRFVKFKETDVVSTDSAGNIITDSAGNKIIIGRNKIIIEDENETDTLTGFEIKFNGNQHILNLNDQLTRQFVKFPNAFNYQFISSAGNNMSKNALLWDEIALTEKEKTVIEALKIVDPDIEGMSFVADNINKNLRNPIVKLKGVEKPFPLKSMGDGIFRILKIILALVNSDNGFLFIDEFENGLHYSVQKKLWEIIFRLADRLNVQIFATTHSNDTIFSFAKVLDEAPEFEGALFRLAQKQERIKAFQFSKEEITEAARQNINLR
jgi:AAA15 family ATPase/GTPase